MSVFDPAEVKLAASNNKPFQLSLRFLTGKTRLNVGENSYVLDIRDGKMVDFALDNSGEPVDVTFTGSEDSWRKVLADETPPGCQSPFYNDGRGGIIFEGDWVNGVGLHSHALTEFFRVLRTVVSGKVIDYPLPEVDRKFDTAVGRYMYVHIQGVQYRIYYEESGQGSIPLLLQHSAGSDSRQMRHILEDPDYQKHYRIIAYDLPYHGKSLPPISHNWWDERYVLTKNFLLEMISAIIERLELDRAVFMGSAMGGMLALDVAYAFPDKFRAAIALNAGPPPVFGDAGMEQFESFSSPKLSTRWMSSIMAATTAGTSPNPYRRELVYVYSQGAPGIAEGALNYYNNDYDLTPEHWAAIDKGPVEVYLFTGEDDFMGTDWGTVQVARHMPNTPFKKLRRLGHFAAAENPEAVKEDIWPVLKDIATRSDMSAR